MKYLPYNRFYVDSPFKPDEAQQALGKEVSPRSTKFLNLGSSVNGTYFMGYISNNQFQFEPEIEGRNSFNPQISGTITAHQNGCRVYVKMGLHLGVAMFLCFAIFFITIASLSITTDAVVKREIKWADFTPLLMLAFIYLMTIVAYKSKSIPAQERLARILRGDITEIK